LLENLNFVCDEKDCSLFESKFGYIDYQKHIDNHWDSIKKECPNGCKKPMLYSSLDEHFEDIRTSEGIIKHIENKNICSSITAKCNQCNEKIIYSKIYDHSCFFEKYVSVLVN